MRHLVLCIGVKYDVAVRQTFMQTSLHQVAKCWTEICIHDNICTGTKKLDYQKKAPLTG